MRSFCPHSDGRDYRFPAAACLTASAACNSATFRTVAGDRAFHLDMLARDNPTSAARSIIRTPIRLASFAIVGNVDWNTASKSGVDLAE